MYLAIVASPEIPVPPVGYGGTEWQVDIMIKQLIAKGHKVDLYAGPGCKSQATNQFLIDTPLMSKELDLTKSVQQNSDRYDCIIDAGAVHYPGHISGLKTVSLMLGDPFKIYPHDAVKNRIYGSKELADFYGCPNHPVLSNIIHPNPTSAYWYLGNGRYVVYIGKIHPMKGIHIAAKACAKLCIPFVVGGPISDKSYWSSFKELCMYKGIIKRKDLYRCLGDAVVFVHPTQCCDCDPLAPKEAMLTGTPVVACPNGGICSSVKEGVSGYFAETVDDFVEMIPKAMKLGRWEVRDWILPKVNPSVYVDKLLSYCEKASKGEVW